MNATGPEHQPEPPGSRSTARAEAISVVVGASLLAAALNMIQSPDPAVAGISVTASLVIPVVAAWSVLRRRPRRITAADRVTLVRVALTGALTAALVLVVAGALPARTWTVLIVAAVAAILDGVDGWVARHSDGGSQAGARFDTESDAAALLVLSGLLALTVGWWVLLIGLMRYLFAAVALVRPSWRRGLPNSGFRKAVAAGQAAVLVVGLAPIVPAPLATVLAAAGLATLCLSFGRDIILLERAGSTDGSDSGTPYGR